MSHTDDRGTERTTAFKSAHLAVKGAFVGFGCCESFEFIYLDSIYICIILY